MTSSCPISITIIIISTTCEVIVAHICGASSLLRCCFNRNNILPVALSSEVKKVTVPAPIEGPSEINVCLICYLYVKGNSSDFSIVAMLLNDDRYYDYGLFLSEYNY